jgi:chromosome segregation ATPase
VVQVVEPSAPQPDYQSQIAEIRTLLADTRESLSAERAHREMLQRICERQDNELVSISTALVAAQSELHLAREDKQQQARQIKVLQDEVTILKTQLAAAAEQLAVNNGLRQGLQLAIDELKRENARLHEQLDKRTEGERGE